MENHLQIREFKQTTSQEPIAKEASTKKAIIIVHQEKQQLTYSENLIKNNAITPTANKVQALICKINKAGTTQLCSTS